MCRQMENFEIFLDSCRHGNINEIDTFLCAGIAPDIQNAEGDTALQISAANGYLNIVTLLLNKGASVNLANNYGWTPLMHAARHGHSDIVSLLIKKEAKININNRLGLRPIDLAAWNGNLSCVKLIIKAGAIIDNLNLMDFQNDLCDISPLMAASLQGHTSVLRCLLKEGSSTSQASPITGLTPLMLAAYRGYRNIAEILIEFGCDVNATDIYGRTALELATLCHRENIIALLQNITRITIKKANSRVPYDILQSVRSGDLGQVKLLLEKNQGLSNYTDPEDGVTPLMIASMLGFVDIVDLLISSGADIDAQDKTNDWTPLMYAVFHKQPEIVHLLLDRGVDVDICTSCGYTALDLALHTASPETDILETLLAVSSSEELLDAGDYLTASSSVIKQDHLSIQKPSSRSDSQARIKDLLGGFSSHLSKLSRSSAVSPSFDLEIPEEMYDVFPNEKVQEGPIAENYLSISKLCAPHARFAHLLKKEKIKAINLPTLPSHNASVDLINTICFKKNLSDKSSPTKPSSRSLRVPNLSRRIKENSSEISKNISKKYTFSESLNVQDISNFSVVSTESKPDSSFQAKDDVFKENIEDFDSTLGGSTLKNISEFPKETITHLSRRDRKDQNLDDNEEVIEEVAAGDLTALLNQESLRKYAEKFRDQEIDLEIFKNLTEEDFDEIGINSFDSRHKLLEIIDKLKNG